MSGRSWSPSLPPTIPFLVALSERAKAVQESFEDRQTSTAEALAELLRKIEKRLTQRQRTT